MTQATNSTPHAKTIGGALEQTLKRIRAAEVKFNRAAGSVTLLAVSKTKPLEALHEAIAAGQLAFGENHLNEALAKIAALEGMGRKWHFIGAIQSNKTKPIATHFDWVHAIDRNKIARRLSAHRPEGLAPLNCCIQLNLDAEDSKAGVDAQSLPALCETVANLPGLALRGLMTLPAPRETFAEQREVFAAVKRLFQEQQMRWPQMDTLSMGMSGDLDAAVAEGSTLLRIGTAIFGRRSPAGSTAG